MATTLQGLQQKLAATGVAASYNIGGGLEGYVKIQFEQRLERSSHDHIKQRRNDQSCQHGTKNCKSINNHDDLHTTCFQTVRHSRRAHLPAGSLNSMALNSPTGPGFRPGTDLHKREDHPLTIIKNRGWKHAASCRRRITSAHHKSISAASRVDLKYALPETDQGSSGKRAKPSQILSAISTP